MRGFFKVTITLMSIIGLFLGISILTVSILGISNAVEIVNNNVRYYACAFKVRDSFVEFEAEGEYTLYKEYMRGEDMHIVPPKVSDILPTNEEDPTYYFKGWDWTGDGLVDSTFPTKAYFSFTANAVFDVVYPEKSEESASDTMTNIFDPLLPPSSSGKGGSK